ncbi:peptide/nickel transport system substrate-binding protein [Rhizobiales bacterium GAS191]|nr:peptide/nickel transport system substrate-binding protein [Rhizobiales bacterium GAS113]SEC43157.1 peptide/nickel transport system substrate-binding protein [Rhizobiales bacterium GAS191]
MRGVLQNGLVGRGLAIGAIALAVSLAVGTAGASGDAGLQPRLTLIVAASAQIPPTTYQDAPILAPLVESGKLPAVAERLPKTPLVVDLKERGREIGRYGGDLRSLVSKARDLRLMTVNTYTRLVGYDEKLTLRPDILEKVEAEDDRIFTFTLREGHRWSDGAPFTAEDFRFYFEDIANNKELSPAGPESAFFVDGQLARFEVLDERHVRYSWDKPNPRFLPMLAQPRPVFICAPAHYLKAFHIRYAPKEKLAALAADAKLRSWAALFNRTNDPYDNANPDMPTLNAWKVVTKAPANRFVFERNPYFHRVDPEGRQLPYIDRLFIDLATASLFAPKANAGEVDLLARGLSMSDAPVLKEGEADHGYRTLLWPIARGSSYALYPNLTVEDPVWRALNRDQRFRVALSLAIDRRIINNAMMFGLGLEGNNTVMPESALDDESNRSVNATYNSDLANSLLDGIGLTKRGGDDTRLLPDGRELEIVVEVAGDSRDIIDVLQLITEFWRDVGVKLFIKPQEPGVLRNRSYSGRTIMVAGPGLDNAIPTAEMPPAELAPVLGENYSWPLWGEYEETRGKHGEAVDLPEAKRLLDLYRQWLATSDTAEQTRVWKEMLAINAKNVFSIGTVTRELQPVVVSKRLRNVPEKALFAFEPTSYFGVYRMEEFFFSE